MTKSYKPDYILLGTVILLLVFGLIMVASASVIKGFQEFGDRYYYAKHQLIYGILPGLILFLIASKIYYRRWVKLSLPFFVLGIMGLIAVLATSSTLYHGGATRWIVIGSYTLQPSEFVKMFFIIYLAAWLDKRGNKINDARSTLVPFLIIISILGFLIISQPNLGMLGIVTMSALALYYISGVKLLHVFSLIVLGVSAAAVFIKTEPYRLKRFATLLNPSADILGAGYQINQAVIAIGSGGLFGLGLGQSRQKYNYLPEPFGDSIFAITGEELGFVGLVALIALFLIFVWRCFAVAKNAPDNFGRLLVSGITIILAIQFFMNIAAITQFMPLTGVPMPFISYGGSAMISALFGVGVILNVSSHTPRKNY
jgi:cell division protein FtsW